MSNVLAVILAGGSGDRLSLLAAHRATPAVPFAGKYRIIDFALSNCVNSGIYDVAVLTQYRPHSLHEHIGIGKPWDLDRLQGGVHLLQPFLGRDESGWDEGTADAVYQNLEFIMESRIDYVLVLGGDHVYRMDYRPLIAFHQEHNADVTIGGVVVPLAEAPRFGIFETDMTGRVVSFEEKPARPRGNQGSMGIYVFARDTLARVLVEDARFGPTMQPPSQHDFGRNIIPQMLARGERVFAYPYTGYWQDVGTVQAYWAAHMSLLEDPPVFDLYDPSWVIHTRSEERPPGLVHAGARVRRSLISDGCVIRGQVEHSVLAPGVVVEAGAVVRDSILLNATVVGAGSTVDRAILDKKVVVGQESRIGDGDDGTPAGEAPEPVAGGITLVGKWAHLPDHLTVGRNCRIDAGVRPEDFRGNRVASGESVANPDTRDAWERELAQRLAAAPGT